MRYWYKLLYCIIIYSIYIIYLYINMLIFFDLKDMYFVFLLTILNLNIEITEPVKLF